MAQVQWLSIVNPSSDLRYASRHVDNTRARIVEALNKASQTDLWSVLLYGARGTPVSYAKEMMADYLSQPADYFSQLAINSPDHLQTPLRPSMPVLYTSLIHHVTGATIGDSLSSLVGCIKQARRKNALLIVTDLDVLDDKDIVPDDVEKRVVDLILKPNPDISGVPIVAVWQMNWNYEPDPKIKRQFGGDQVRIGPYVPSRTGEMCVKYGLQQWRSSGVEFSTVPGSLVPSSQSPSAEELQDILEDVVALEDGACLAWGAIRRTSLPYLAIRLIDDLARSVYSPRKIRNVVIDAQNRIGDVIAESRSDHPLLAAVMTASSQIERMVAVVNEWKVDQRGRVLLPNGFPATSIPISRPLATAWLFGSNFPGFEWPPADWVRPTLRDARNSGQDTEMEDSSNIRSIGHPKAM